MIIGLGLCVLQHFIDISFKRVYSQPAEYILILYTLHITVQLPYALYIDIHDLWLFIYVQIAGVDYLDKQKKV